MKAVSVRPLASICHPDTRCPYGDEIAIAGAREAEAGPLLEKADNLRRNHDFGCSRRLHRILSDVVRSTASAAAAMISAARESRESRKERDELSGAARVPLVRYPRRRKP